MHATATGRRGVAIEPPVADRESAYREPSSQPAPDNSRAGPSSLAELSTATPNGPTREHTRQAILGRTPPALSYIMYAGGDSDLVAALKILAHKEPSVGQKVERPHLGKPYSPDKNNPSASLRAEARTSDGEFAILPPEDPKKTIRGMYLVSPDGTEVLQIGNRTAEGFTFKMGEAVDGKKGWTFKTGSKVPTECKLVIQYDSVAARASDFSESLLGRNLGYVLPVGTVSNIFVRNLQPSEHCNVGELFLAA